MALNASSKVRPKVVELQKRGAKVILEHVEAAAAKGKFEGVKAKETYRAKVRVPLRRTEVSES
ncbi:hypothetical protein PQR57_38770 [Paraburkholderia dipogonis]|uniref:Uncharacterized protein n=1 Tax=Paraburkholderia dipogonis TaxID=1211383 RepID=A0ABW9B3W1_9BURK